MRRERVDPDDAMAVAEQRLAEVRADESCRSSDECALHAGGVAQRATTNETIRRHGPQAAATAGSVTIRIEATASCAARPRPRASRRSRSRPRRGPGWLCTGPTIDPTATRISQSATSARAATSSTPSIELTRPGSRKQPALRDAERRARRELVRGRSLAERDADRVADEVDAGAERDLVRAEVAAAEPQRHLDHRRRAARAATMSPLHHAVAHAEALRGALHERRGSRPGRRRAAGLAARRRPRS